jgi:hypothetical protein
MVDQDHDVGGLVVIALRHHQLPGPRRRLPVDVAQRIAGDVGPKLGELGAGPPLPTGMSAVARQQLRRCVDARTGLDPRMHDERRQFECHDTHPATERRCQPEPEMSDRPTHPPPQSHSEADQIVAGNKTPWLPPGRLHSFGRQHRHGHGYGRT